MARETALVVPVPDAEPIVGRWRAQLDPAAGWGVPAHITVLYPFVDPSTIAPPLIGRIAECLDGVDGFAFALADVAQFGDAVTYLSPRPVEPFRALTDRVWSCWPDHPPYGGAHEEVIPHLTVAESSIDHPEAQRAVESIASYLPIETAASEVWLMAGDAQPGAWRTEHVFPLG